MCIDLTKLLSDLVVSIFTRYSLSPPNLFTVTSPKFILINDCLISDISVFEFSVLISIKVPPLKSTPKFNPLKKRKEIERIININDNKLNFLY